MKELELMQFQFLKIEVFVPEEYIEKVRDSLNGLGVLTVGNYDNVFSYSHVKGHWRPLEGSTPFDGTIGEITTGTECKMEFRIPTNQLDEVITIIKQIHPYEEPVINVLPLIA